MKPQPPKPKLKNCPRCGWSGGHIYCPSCHGHGGMVERVDFDPLGGAARGVGRCTCAAGPGTNPACPVHP